MSDFETAARPYAKAIFELASESAGDAMQFWSETLNNAAQIVSDEQLQAVIQSPSVPKSQLVELVLSVMSSLKDAPRPVAEVENLIRLLAENGRLPILPSIFSAYEAMKQAAEGAIEVTVTSARKLTAKQSKTITSQMKQRLGKEVTIKAEIDQTLIAGAIIQAGDLVIDGTASGKLAKLTTVLNK